MPDASTTNRLAKVESLYNQGLKYAAAQLSRLELEKDSSNVEALIWLAKSTSQPDEAEKAIRRANNLAPENPQVRELAASRQQNYAGAGAYNPYSAPSTGYNAPPDAPNAPQPWSSFNQNQSSPANNPLTGFTPGPQPSSSYDYLKNLSATVTPSVPPATPVGKVTVKSTPSAAGIIFGTLFLIIGLGLAIYWTIQVVGYTSDVSTPSSQLQGQIVKLSNTTLTADIKDGGGQRNFDITDQASKSLVPLVSDPKTQANLVNNSVVLTVSKEGRLLAVNVLSPTQGQVAVPANGLLGFGQATDWAVTAVGGILALLGLVLLGRTLGKRRT